MTQVDPPEGPTAGGTEVLITGTNLTGASSVSFGGVAADAFSVLSPTQISVVSPPHAAGPVEVVVVTPGGSSTPSPVRFTYTTGSTGTTSTTTTSASTTSTTAAPTSTTTTTLPPTTTTTSTTTTTPPGGTTTTTPRGSRPEIQAVAPGRAGVSGGAYVLILGRHLGGVTSVTFGGVAADLTLVSNDVLMVRTPAHAAGRVEVVVTTPTGTNVPTRVATFRYQQRVCVLWLCWWG